MQSIENTLTFKSTSCLFCIMFVMMTTQGCRVYNVERGRMLSGVLQTPLRMLPGCLPCRCWSGIWGRSRYRRDTDRPLCCSRYLSTRGCSEPGLPCWEESWSVNTNHQTITNNNNKGTKHSRLSLEKIVQDTLSGLRQSNIENWTHENFISLEEVSVKDIVRTIRDRI